jgi:hypothetical protein
MITMQSLKLGLSKSSPHQTLFYTDAMTRGLVLGLEAFLLYEIRVTLPTALPSRKVKESVPALIQMRLKRPHTIATFPSRRRLR